MHLLSEHLKSGLQTITSFWLFYCCTDRNNLGRKTQVKRFVRALPSILGSADCCRSCSNASRTQRGTAISLTCWQLCPGALRYSPSMSHDQCSGVIRGARGREAELVDADVSPSLRTLLLIP